MTQAPIVGKGGRHGGIDPGKDGCLAVIGENGNVEFHDVPTIQITMAKKSKRGNERHRRVYDFAAVVAMVREAKLDFVTIEKVQPMPSVGPRRVQMGAVSAFSSGEGYGMWLMCLAALGIPHQIVHASHWKAVLMHGEPKTKEATIPFAQRLYPAAAPQLRGPKGAMLIDRADALLIAHYGRVGLQ
jgi:hypothetical protein